MSSGSEGLYLSPFSDMSLATSDCLEPYFYVFFPTIAYVLTFLGPFVSPLFFVIIPFLGSWPVTMEGVGPVRMLECTEQRSERFLM